MNGVCKEEYKPNKSNISGLSKENILLERLWLLEKLKDRVRAGELKAIEVYSKILSEISNDLEHVEDDEGWQKVLADLIEDDA